MTLPLGMVLVFTACGAIIAGLVLYEVSRHGPRTFLYVGLSALVLNAGVGIGASYLARTPDSDSVPVLPSACLGIGFGLLPMCFGWVTIPRRKAYLTNIAPQIKKFGLRRFADLDRDGDGVITQGDLADLKDVRLNPTERGILAELQWLFDDIGHVIEVVPTPSLTYNQFQSTVSGFPVWNTGMDYYCVRGVNKADLEKYPGEVNDRYVNW